jgi:hypothetical protein
VSEPRACAFCGRTDSPLTKEHVYPRSWKQYFPLVEGPDRAMQLGHSGYVERRGANDQFDNQVRDICASCNNGWMMHLDEEVRPFVIPLALGERDYMTAEEATAFRSWATKLALVRTLQDRNQAQQARPERFHDFHENRQAFGVLAIQAASCDRRHMDNNQSWVIPEDTSAVSNVVTFSIGHLFVQVGIFGAEDTEYVQLTRVQMLAVRHMTQGKVVIVREGKPWTANGTVSDTELMLAREPAALIGAAPAMENSMKRTPIKQSPGGSFGNPYGVPNINDVEWKTYE